jgi:hypothetical protein
MFQLSGCITRPSFVWLANSLSNVLCLVPLFLFGISEEPVGG